MKLMGRTVWRGQRWDDTSRTRGQVRAAEKRKWRSDADHFRDTAEVMDTGRWAT